MKKIYLIVTALFLVFFVAQTNLSAQVFYLPGPSTDKIPGQGSTPTVRVYVYGLSVLYYSKDSTEIGFLKDEHTPVTINIYKNSCQGEYIPVIPAGEPPFSINEKVKIEIKKTTSTSTVKNHFYQDLKKNEKDFLYMPYLCGEKFYPGATLNLESPADLKNHLSAKLVLQDAVFYSQELSDGEAERTTTNSRESIGRVGRALGADITCEPSESVSVSVTTDNPNRKPFNRTFSPADGQYLIEIRTDTQEKDHFHHIYDHIIDLPSDLNLPEYGFRYKKPQKVWHLCQAGRVTEYACQTFGSCGGTLPELW